MARCATGLAQALAFACNVKCLEPMKYKLEEVLELVRKRPGAYLVNDSVYAIGQFIVGVTTTVRMNEGWDHHGEISFMEWVEHKYQICNPAWNWTRILHHVAGSEQEALALFFELWPDYLKEKSSYPLDKPRLDYGYPKESITDEFWSFLCDQQWPLNK